MFVRIKSASLADTFTIKTCCASPFGLPYHLWFYGAHSNITKSAPYLMRIKTKLVHSVDPSVEPNLDLHRCLCMSALNDQVYAVVKQPQKKIEMYYD